MKASSILVRVIDLYSVKPLDLETLAAAARETGQIITVEDHYGAGGLGEAVASALSPEKIPVHIMAVRKMPMSGKPGELFDYEQISREEIVNRVRALHEDSQRFRRKKAG